MQVSLFINCMRHEMQREKNNHNKKKKNKSKEIKSLRSKSCGKRRASYINMIYIKMLMLRFRGRDRCLRSIPRKFREKKTKKKSRSHFY